MAIQARTIAQNIAGLTISGVSMRGLTNLPVELMERDCPALFPNPLRFISNVRITQDAFGDLGEMPQTLSYDLAYTFAYKEIGAGRNLLDVYDGMVQKALAVADAIITADVIGGAVGFEIKAINNFGVVVDPSGKAFHGCDFVFAVTEFVN